MNNNVCTVPVKSLDTPPEWRSGLRHCITVQAVPLEILGLSPGSVAAGHDRETHGVAHNCPSVIRIGGLSGKDALVPSRTSDSCGGPGAVHADMVARCTRFLRHIGAAGFRVKWVLCQVAVRLGWVVFWRTRGSRPLSLLCPYGSCSDETRLTSNWITRKWGNKK